MVGVQHREREPFAVGRPVDADHLGGGGQAERPRIATLDLQQPWRAPAVPAVDAAAGRIDAHAGQLVHGRGQLGQLRIEDGVGQQHVLAPGPAVHTQGSWGACSTERMSSGGDFQPVSGADSAAAGAALATSSASTNVSTIVGRNMVILLGAASGRVADGSWASAPGRRLAGRC